jgi:sorbitol-specific phosphotransferase system component IIC
VIWIFSHTKIHPNTFFEANVGLIPFINHQEFFITKEIALASYYIRLKALPLLAIDFKKTSIVSMVLRYFMMSPPTW